MGFGEMFSRENIENKRQERKENRDEQKKLDEQKQNEIDVVIKDTKEELSNDKERLVIENKVFSYISQAEKAAGSLGLFEKKVLKGLQETKKIIQYTPDDKLLDVIQEELKKAKTKAEKYPKIAAPLIPILTAALDDSQLQISGKSLEKQSPVSWKTILKSTNQSSANFKQYIETSRYQEAYNDVFDLMSMVNFQPNTVNFKGEEINVTEDYIKNFKNLISSQFDTDEEVDFNNIQLEHVDKQIGGNAQEGKLSFYPSDMRVIVVPYKNKAGQEFTTYITFGDINQVQKDLAKGLEEDIENKDVKDFFVKIPEINDDNKAEFGDYINDVGSLKLDAHGGPEALNVLFKKGKMIDYLKQSDSLKNTFDSVLNYSKYKGDYSFSLYNGIKNDEQLMKQYSKIILSPGGDKYLGPVSSLEKRQSIVLGLLTSPFFDVEKDGELFTLLSKEKLNLQQALAVPPNSKNKDIVKTLQSQVEGFAKMIVNSPLWAGIITLLDSFFGKGGLMKKLKDSPLAEQLDKQFKDKYSITGDQKIVIENVYDEVEKIKDNDSIFIKNGKDKVKEKIQKMGKFENESGIESKGVMTNRLVEKPELLDAKILSNFFVLDNGRRSLKTDNGEIDYGDIFEINNKNEPIVRNNVDKTKLNLVLSHVISSPNINNIILDTDMKLKGGVDHGNPGQKGIQTEADYAAFVTAYLMGGSKSDGGSSFHYVITETNMPNQGMWIEQQNASTNVSENPESPEKLFEREKKELKNKIDKNITDGKYDGKDIISSYSYASDDIAPQKHYQDDILEPMKKLFDNKPVEGNTKTNFDLLVGDFNNNQDLLKTENFIHIKNMFIDMNGLETDESKLLINKSVIENMDKMSEVKVEGNALLFSNNDGKIILSSGLEGKLEAKYEVINTI